ncbi:putative histone-lysine N-methyltransferase chromatin remodeling SET family [Rosa chinensis]|uniref:Putative histone-lysine N-methyltransferase chromatin remodeling SET family n=1 Tax=Rosa chinensis TaxID=74649 RepID=A0A2P6R5H2_ROSCH|nr:histone-lysine N-methyltransferase SUVR4 isoform X3 [Rosa chinensis]PRQ41680.1 putative histone-lysine N-methyltransferase chromatin remodeling SET family [Rosa chinensis]
MAPTREQLREHLANAYKAANAVGISKEDIKPVLRRLYQAFDENWEPIEADNYRVLIDTYFELKEKEDDEQRDQKPRKRRHLTEEEDQASFRTGSSSEFSLGHSRHNGNHRSTRHLDSGDGSVHPERASASAVSCSNHKNNFTKPKNKVSTDDVTVSAGPTSIRRPGPVGAARIQRPKPESNAAPITCEDKKPLRCISDITKSTEKVAISLVDEVGNGSLPKFNYIPHNIIYENAHLNISLSRIADEDCCLDCSGDCLSSALPCACAHETGGEFVYTPEGLLKEEFLSKHMALVREPEKQNYVYCQDCPIERSKNEDMPESCKGHVVRQFIKECWRKCGCDVQCGNRVVQRGISCKLQVFWTSQGKGWGVRTLEVLEKGSFVCEYVGEILTNTELYNRNMKSNGNDRHTYPVTLDADWGSEQILRDEDALCLDGTLHGNVARFINHRCFDGNLVDIPVQVETPDRHYYHLAFFTTRKVNAFEELTWDYQIDFDDEDHPIKAFHCTCGSEYCRSKKRKGKKVVNLG